MPDGWLYLSSLKITIAIRIESGIIVESPPITRKFLGQPVANLARWLGDQGGFKWARLR